MTLLDTLRERLRAGFAAAGIAGPDLERVGVTGAADLRFGDYQSNAAMVLAKQAGKNPRALAEEVKAATEVEDLAAIDIAGPGFLNFRIKPEAFAAKVGALLEDSRLGVSPAEDTFRVVLDFSAPNVAKPMHVGHIRSTVIGDALCRTLRFLGHTVISDNHLGDWGTQFGMIIYGYKHFCDQDAYQQNPVEELARLYRLVRQLMDYHEGCARVEPLAQQVAQQAEALDEAKKAAGVGEGKKPDKKTAKHLRRQEAGLQKGDMVFPGNRGRPVFPAEFVEVRQDRLQQDLVQTLQSSRMLERDRSEEGTVDGSVRFQDVLAEAPGDAFAGFPVGRLR